MNIVIVGNSAAGLSAARTVRRLKDTVRITVISDEPGSAYARCLIPDVLAGEKDSRGIFYVAQNFYEEYQINLLSGKKVNSLDIVNNRLVINDGETIDYNKLLVATGASPIVPDWPRINIPGVFTLRTASQAVAAANAALNCSAAVVVGGGLVSLKAAYALKKRGVPEVTVVVKSPHLLIKQLDQKGAALLEKELIKAGIKFIYGVDPVAVIEGVEGAVKAVKLEGGSQLSAGMVLIGKGVRANTELISLAGGKVDRGIVVNDCLETSLPGIYAAGDCIEVKDLITGCKTTSGLWTLAVEQGRCAGYNLVGQVRTYHPPLTRLNSAQFGAVPFVSVGNVRGGDEEAIFNENGVYRKVCIKDNRLVGLIMVGSVERAGIYTALIKKARPLERLKDKVVNGTISGVDVMGL